jgi:hypothetical protein
MDEAPDTVRQTRWFRTKNETIKASGLNEMKIVLERLIDKGNLEIEMFDVDPNIITDAKPTRVHRQ